jgi:hypothetical protein
VVSQPQSPVESLPMPDGMGISTGIGSPQAQPQGYPFPGAQPQQQQANVGAGAAAPGSYSSLPGVAGLANNVVGGPAPVPGVQGPERASSLPTPGGSPTAAAHPGASVSPPGVAGLGAGPGHVGVGMNGQGVGATAGEGGPGGNVPTPQAAAMTPSWVLPKIEGGPKLAHH